MSIVELFRVMAKFANNTLSPCTPMVKIGHFLSWQNYRNEQYLLQIGRYEKFFRHLTVRMALLD